MSSEPKSSRYSQTEKQEVSSSERKLEEQMEYPTGLKLGLITLALCLSVFLVSLDNTIIATAIPKITDQFDSLDDVGWYGSSYLLTTAAFQLFYGRLYSLLSMKWVFMGAISIFELGSLICGVAPNSKALIVGRAVAGLGSAGILSGAFVIIAHAVPMGKRPMYTGIIGAMYGIASVAGPLLGGVSAVQSGIDNLPLILSLVISMIIAGAVTSAVGYYTPFMILSSILMSVGAGLLSTLTVTIGHADWIVFQIVFGMGVGCGAQQSIMAVQTVLSREDVASGTALINLMQTLGGALFVSVGENVFTNKLVSGLVSQVPSVDPAIVLSAGATSLQSVINPELLPAVLLVYNQALMSAFYVSIAMGALSLVGSGAMEWRSIKGKNVEIVG
ncbi:major facilitator superfamily domain-containing protein [Mycena maculata]|uniref:Major facilitator superfamily domain-containing protein n=1 Tax=Mycena maculata TaxID=230809 RepID=A0AAD7JAH2_9AGAR|nr:major facilitator superfamily domain-containing protein [Mycena maculata]